MVNLIGSFRGEQPSYFLGAEKPISNDLFYLILNNCSQASLRSLECVGTSYRELTRRRWTALLVESRLDFEWDFGHTEEYPEKVKFRLGKALHAYIDARETLIEGKVTPDQVATRFADIMRRFPFFGAFVYSDLRTFGEIETPYQSLFEKKITFLQSTTTAGGNLVLQSILLSHQVRLNGPKTLNSLYQHFQKAIEAKATCASIFACQTVDPIRHHQFLLNLANQSIVRFKDYRGLESLLNVNNALVDPLYSQGIWEPPVLYFKGRLSADHQSGEPFYDEALKLYGKDAPEYFLCDIAYVKYILKKWNEAESMCEKAITAYGDNVPAVLWYITACVKCELNKWDEADPLCEKAITAYGDNIPTKIWQNAAHIKKRLKKWEEAETMWEKAIAAYGDHVPACAWDNAAFVKCTLNKLNAAEMMWEKAITAYGDNVPAIVWNNTALLKDKLNKWKEAEILLERAITAYKDNIPLTVLEDAASVKIKLKKWKEAENLLEKVIADYGDNVRAIVWYNAAFAKVKLKNWNAAEPLCEKMIAAYKDDVSPSCWVIAAKVKSRLNKWKEAKIYIKKAITVSGENVSALIKKIDAEVEAHFQE